MYITFVVLNQPFYEAQSFAYRHIGPKAVDVDQMLSAIGVDSIDTLIDQTVPAAIRAAKDLV